MTGNLLTLVADPGFTIGAWAVAASGGLGVAASAVFAIQAKNPSSATFFTVGVTTVTSAIIALGGFLVASTGTSSGDFDRWTEETNGWLSEEHDLTLLLEEDEVPNTAHLYFRNGNIMVAVDSEGEHHAVELVRYEGELAEGSEGKNFYLEDVETGEPYVNNDNQ